MHVTASILNWHTASGSDGRCLLLGQKAFHVEKKSSSCSSTSTSDGDDVTSPRNVHGFVKIQVEKKRQLKMEYNETIRYDLPSSSFESWPPPATFYTIVLPYEHCNSSSVSQEIKSCMGEVLRQMRIFSAVAIQDLSPDIGFAFLESAKKAASRGHDEFHLWVFVQVEDTSEIAMVKRHDSCGICLEELSVAMKMPCSHVFHDGCIRGWFKTGKTNCPICRFQF